MNRREKTNPMGRPISEKLEQINHGLALIVMAACGWIIPGGGYAILGKYKRAAIVFFTITVTFLIGIYIGSIGAVTPASVEFGVLGKINPWYLAQMLNSPLVAMIGKATAAGAYPVYGKPQEIGQLYTSISGLLNLLCITNCLFIAHVGAKMEDAKDD